MSNLNNKTDNNNWIPRAHRKASAEIQINSETNSAIFIKNVCKYYDGNPVLQNFSMNVEKGTIYGLLGSSGCGKTTMLSCIVGLENWESGDLLVFGKKPGSNGNKLFERRLGYMPQGIALNKHLYIREIVQFYGYIYNMTNKEISERWGFLSKLLQLPQNLPLIGDLSGGQQRRASLALALIHNPELLILDEPTAGVDPLLRKNIWDYLYNLVKTSGTTVLITTHYIEEARFSNTIGVMRKGRLLIEDNPTSILRNYNCDLLEDAVVHLCREDDKSSKNIPLNSQDLNKVVFSSSWKNTEENCKNSQQINGLFHKSNDFDSEQQRPIGQHIHQLTRKISNNLGKTFKNYSVFQSLKRIYGLSIVILLTFLRNPVFLGLIVFLPAVQGSLSLLTIGSKPRNLHIGIVNNEFQNSTKNCNLPNNFANQSCQLNLLSCQFLQYLSKGDLLNLDNFDSEMDALEQVKLGKSWGYLIFPENFSESSIDLASAKHFALNESLEGSRIHVHLDHSQYIQSKLIIKHLYASYLQFIKQIALKCDFNTILDELPLNFRQPVYGKYDDDYSTFVIPGVVLISLFGIGIGLTGISHVSDRRQGTLGRASAAGLKTFDIIIANSITQIIVTAVQLIIWNTILHFIFDFTILGSPWLWIVFCIIVQLIGVGFGLLIGQIFKDETQVLLILIFLYTIFVFCGCVFLPVEYMSKFWQNVANFVPTFLPTMSTRSLVIRGVSLTHPLIWPGLVSGIGWILLLSICCIISFKVVGNR